MERDSRLLTEAANQYHLEVNGIKFWTPYWINWDKPPYFLNGPFRGKGTPGQIKLAVKRKLSQHPETKPRSEAELHRLMRQWGIGIDCSGLAYFVLSRWLRQTRGSKLADHSFAPKSEIIAASSKPSWSKAGVGQATLERLPDWVTISEVCQLFHKDPRHLTNVARLTSNKAAVTIDRVKDAKPGDLIKMTSQDGDHLGLITEISSQRLRYVESRGLVTGAGQVQFRDITILDRDLGLEAQQWADKSIFNPAAGDRLCRLRAVGESV